MNEIINDKQGSRFVLDVDGLEVYVLYAEDKETIDLYSTYTPPQLRGQGLAEKLCLLLLNMLKKRILKLFRVAGMLENFR